MYLESLTIVAHGVHFVGSLWEVLELLVGAFNQKVALDALVEGLL